MSIRSPQDEEKDLDAIFADEDEDDYEDSENVATTAQPVDLNFDTDLLPDSFKLDENRSTEKVPPGLLLPSDFLEKQAVRLKIHPICYRCQHFSHIDRLLYCSSCRKAFHEPCYRKELCHQDRYIDKCDAPTTFRVHIWVSALLDSSTSPHKQLKLHVEDVYTKWFGVPHTLASDQYASPKLLVWPRMHYIFQDIQVSNKSVSPSPSICSFFGETGAGKSTIIKALILMQSTNLKNAAPVSGNDADTLKSTSGDVHLYPDPATLRSERPVVYADCEGLRGDRRPVASELKDRVASSGATPTRQSSALGAGTLRHSQFSSRYQEGRSNSMNPLHGMSSSINPLHAIQKGLDNDKLLKTLLDHERQSSKTWKLKWKEISESTSKWRAEVVKNLYPRFLYIFSDVVCYVTRNTKTTKVDLANLVEWALVGYDQTTNQGVRPALIIIINNDDRNNVAQWCDTDYATQAVLDDLAQSTWFEEQKALWESRGRIVRDSKALLGLYYDGLRVVSVPSPRALSTGVILQQYQKLCNEIRISSERVQRRRKASGMKVDVESITLYTEIAFEKLSRNLLGTIDLYDIISKVKSLPRSFAEHLNNVLAKLNRENEGGNEMQLVERLLPYLASTMALELRAEPPDTRDNMANDLLSECNKAFHNFHAHHWRCEAVKDEATERLSNPANVDFDARSSASSMRRERASLLSEPSAVPADSAIARRRHLRPVYDAASDNTTPAKRLPRRPELNRSPADLTDLPQRSASARNAKPSTSEPTNFSFLLSKIFSEPQRKDDLKTKKMIEYGQLQRSSNLGRGDSPIDSFEELASTQSVPAGAVVNRPNNLPRLTTPLGDSSARSQIPYTRPSYAVARRQERGAGGPQKRCINYRDSHEKGHQYPAEGRSRIPTIRSGGFVSSFAADELTSKLIDNLEGLFAFPDLLQTFGNLCSPPDLPSYTQTQPVLYVSGGYRYIPWIVRMRSAGGGVRGVLELHVLQALVREVGFGIPIQELFDLAIGTSTGGIIALGLFRQGWSPTQGLGIFKDLVLKAFEKRFWYGVPVIRHAAQLLYSHRYHSEPIDAALQAAFGGERANNQLFKSTRFDGGHIPKVGVVAVSGEDQTKAYLLASYSREWESQQVSGSSFEDYLRREEDPLDELHTWEAARSTSAAPTYFREYWHNKTSRTYSDGGTRFNNPIAMTDWERRLIWPDADHLPPDVIISIGAGVGPKIPRELKGVRDLKEIGQLLHGMLPRGLKERVGVMHQMYKATLDCERLYQEYSIRFAGNSILSNRCHRLNVVLSEKPCKLDDVAKIFELEAAAVDFLARRSTKTHIQAIAHRLRASLFYFDVVHDEQVIEAGSQVWDVTGRLRCRLSYDQRGCFTNLLEGGHRGRCQFRVRSKLGMTTLALHAGHWDLKSFAVDVSFRLAERQTTVYIEMRFEAEERWEIISGFPRVLEASPRPSIHELDYYH